MGLKGADDEVAADFIRLPSGEPDQLVWRRLALDIAPVAQDLIDRPLQLARDDHGPGLHPLKKTLAEVVGEPRNVIHVTVRDADDVAGEREVWTAADVEADVELWNLANRFLARDAVPDDVNRPERDLGKFLNEKRLLFSHGRAEVTGAGEE